MTVNDILNWPAVGLIAFFTILVVFHSPIRSLFSRLKKVDKTGATFDHAQDDAGKPRDETPFTELMKHPVSASVLIREAELKAELTQKHMSDADTITLLIRGVTLTKLEKEFAYISHVIFGSQLQLLVDLSATRNSLPIQRAKTLFEEAQSRFTELHAGRTFEEWFEFLTTTGLVAVAADRMDITTYGTDLLKYLLENRQAHSRQS